MQWPPDYTTEYLKRIKHLKLLLADENIRAAAVAVYRNGAEGCIDFINDWCVTYDPRKKDPEPKLMPFLLFPRQEDLVHFLWECYRDGEDGLIEKARDMGATWVCVCFSIWLFLFYPGVSLGWGSRKRDLVDDLGNPDSIFEKMRIVLRALPPFLLPTNFSVDDDTPQMKILDRVNGTTIAGETGDDIGRGGRSTMYFKDESAHYERPEKIEAALGDNTDVQIDISSVNGHGNPFARRREAGVEWERGVPIPSGKVRVFIMDWRDHPAKTQEWYDKRRQKAVDEGLLHIFAQEVDRDYSGSQERVIIPSAWAKAAVDAHIKLGIKIEGSKSAFQDVADGGLDKNALLMRHGILLFYAEDWGGEAGDAAEKAVPLCVEQGVYELFYDAMGVGSGFKVGINHMKEQDSWPESMRVFPWMGGAKVLDPDEHSIPGDLQSPLNKDLYGNLKAQGFFRLRARFQKTYQAVVHGKKFPHDELISISSAIPRDVLSRLLKELSQPVRKKNGEGKIIVDKTPNSTKSPNLADGVNGVYNPAREISILDVI